MENGAASFSTSGGGGGGGARPRRQSTQRTRSSMKKAIRVLNGAAKGDEMEDEEDEDEEDEEEEEEEEEEEIEEEETHEEVAGEKEYGYSHGRPASARSGSTDMQAFERGAMVRIVRTSDVDQRVPHTVGKIGLIEDVPQHPNTWFKVRIRDGDVVYKYRPSALLLVNSDDVDLAYDDEYEEEPEPRTTKLRSNSTSSYNGGSRRSRDDGGDDTDGIDDSEGEQKEQDDDDEEMDEMEIDTRVRVQLGTLSRRERDLKKYQGKLGVIIATELEGVKVQLDSEDIITIQQKHLVAAPDAPRDDEVANSGQDSDSELPKGQLLSDLDPDMWIDRRCRVNVGKFKGRFGRVLRSGNGWVQLRLDNSNENTAKRAYELTLLEDMDTINQLYAKSVAKKRDQGGGAREDDDDDEDDDEDGTRSGTEDNMAAEQTEDSQGEESGGKRSRRLASRSNYGISWIEKKVWLPSRKGVGIVKKADRETCTVEIGSSKVLKVYKKKDLELLDEESTKAGRGQRNRNSSKAAKDKLGLPEGVVLMGTTAARYAAFQDQVKKFIMRRREKFKKRPNLLGWMNEFEAKLGSTELRDKEDPDVIDLLVVPHCEICGVEKEELKGECWNSNCPRCVNFDVDNFEMTEESYARMPILPIPSEKITNTVCLRAVESQRKRKRRQTSSPLAGDAAGHIGLDEVVSMHRGFKLHGSDAKKAKKDGSKIKKVKSDVKKSKKPGKASPTATSSEKSSSSKKAKPEGEKSSPGGASMNTPDQPADHAGSFRPQYDSVFSR